MPLVATVTPPNNLPHFLTTFIGRAGELTQVEQQLSAGRLVTLTGPAGAGKTRLALQAAIQVLPAFPGGAWWCDLATVADPAFVPQAVAAAVPVPLPSEQPVLAALTEALAGPNRLLVLDNCEHLLAACAALSLALLQHCANVRILATSLQALGLPQERVWSVPPLALDRPRAAGPAEADAVLLFAERAAHVLPSFQLNDDNRTAVSAICRRLDGLPLAVELAAARVRLLSVAEIAARLDDAVGLLSRGSRSTLPRHQTLRLALDWSAQFLAPEERRLLRRLAVFAGPFTLEMAQAVGGDDAPPNAVLDRLEALSDKSFVTLLPRTADSPARSRLLEVVRQYARTELEMSGDAADTRDRYLAWSVAWAETAAPRLTGPQRAVGRSEFEANEVHFRATLRWACTARRAEAGLRLAAALSRYWMTSGPGEGRAWLDELLAMETAARRAGTGSAPPSVLAWALLHDGRLAVRLGDSAGGLRRGLASLDLFQSIGDDAGRLAALNLLALAAQDSGQYDLAESYYAEGLALSRSSHADRMTSVLLVNQGLMYYERQDYRRVGPIWSEAYAGIERLSDESIASRDNLGCLLMMTGELDAAEALLQHELKRQQQLNVPFEMAILMMDLGEVARRRGDPERAQDWLSRALERQQQIGDRLRLHETLVNLGSLARNRGDLASARALYDQSLAGLTSAGYTRLVSHAHVGLGLVAAAQQRDDEAEEHFRQALQIAQRGRHQVSRLEALEELAGLLARRGQAALAARWLAVTEAARIELLAPIPPVERPRYEQRVAQLRAELGPEQFLAARAEASGLSAEQLAAHTLPAPAPAPIGSPEPTLRVRALGLAEVAIGPRTLGSGDWTYTKSKELFFFLLTHGPTPKAEIGLRLWPEASPSQLRASFHTTLHHLRRALGRPDWIVHNGGAYAVKGSLPLDYDVRNFERHLRQAQAELVGAASATGRLRAISHLNRAAGLWRGDFLANMDAGEWAIFQREALRRALLDGLLQLAELHFAEADYAAAAGVYQRVLSLDAYIEVAHRGVMRCRARRGEAALAVRHYQDLCQLLRQELKTLPSPETTLLFDRICRGDDI